MLFSLDKSFFLTLYKKLLVPYNPLTFIYKNKIPEFIPHLKERDFFRLRLKKNHNSKIVREFCKYVLRGRIYVGFSFDQVFFEEDKDKFKSYPLSSSAKGLLEKVTEVEIEE